MAQFSEQARPMESRGESLLMRGLPSSRATNTHGLGEPSLGGGQYGGRHLVSFCGYGLNKGTGLVKGDEVGCRRDSPVPNSQFSNDTRLLGLS